MARLYEWAGRVSGWAAGAALVLAALAAPPDLLAGTGDVQSAAASYCTDAVNRLLGPAPAQTVQVQTGVDGQGNPVYQTQPNPDYAPWQSAWQSNYAGCMGNCYTCTQGWSDGWYCDGPNPLAQQASQVQCSGNYSPDGKYINCVDPGAACTNGTTPSNCGDNSHQPPTACTCLVR